ncbi:MAG TPA: TIM-barrel domain-containing protein [Treponemataceae bacterium]|nr:TIM-barrel domain-containing protein [Treponemataceae bacterium]
MIQMYKFGTAIKTDAVVAKLENSAKKNVLPKHGSTHITKEKNTFEWTYTLKDTDIVYGLGEANRGINKRGWIYKSWCTDDFYHTEEKESLYGAHNFIIVYTPPCSQNNCCETAFGLFFDFPGKITFDIGYTKQNTLHITVTDLNLDVYEITADKPLNDTSSSALIDIVTQFRQLIGQSYIPPRWAFGLGQSRWGYKTEADIRRVYEGYKNADIPLDAIYLDIDYMVDYKDFTIDTTKFPHFKELVSELKKDGVRLVPIIDAGVKIEKGYDVYEEGKERGFFCKRKDGTDFAAGVWPGRTHFPDFLNPKARQWFGEKYKVLVDEGIEGFWNDMNEPAIFYSDEGLAEVFTKIKKIDKKNLNIQTFFEAKDLFNTISNSMDDYKRFYHNTPEGIIRHDKVHNLYGYNMTRAAGDAFKEISPHKRLLLFSRASSIGMHRYGGIWTGDNQSWWQHILLNLKMLPSLNMCGFLYVGADTGGFGANATRDILLRWLALSIFTPLFRNHAALGTRNQEFYLFEQTEDFKSIVQLRYRLIPYLYSEFMKAALNNTMMFRPLNFQYPEDNRTHDIEDQLLLGNEIMIAPIYTQNAKGRYVYLPENMTKVVWHDGTIVLQEKITKGDHYIPCTLNQVVFFIKENHTIPLTPACTNTDQLNYNTFELIGSKGATYELYTDDGYTTNPKTDGTFELLTYK